MSLFHTLQWRHSQHDYVSNHRRLDCLLYCLFRRRSHIEREYKDLIHSKRPQKLAFSPRISVTAHCFSVLSQVIVWLVEGVAYFLEIFLIGERRREFQRWKLHWTRHPNILELTRMWGKISGIHLCFQSTMTSNGNIFRVTGPLWGESTGHRRIPGTKCQWALMFSLMSAWTNGWANNRDPGDLRRHSTHYDVIVMHCPPHWLSIHVVLSIAGTSALWSGSVSVGKKHRATWKRWSFCRGKRIYFVIDTMITALMFNCTPITWLDHELKN